MPEAVVARRGSVNAPFTIYLARRIICWRLLPMRIGKPGFD